MIRITIELDRHGKGKEVKTLGSIDVVNTGTGTDRKRNYRAEFKDRNGRVFRRVELNDWQSLNKSIWKLLRTIITRGVKA